MNGKEKRKLTEFPSALDGAVIKKFGKYTKCETRYHFFGDMKYHTCFKDNGKNKREIDAFIDGFTKGNLELRDRLLTK